jgi:hypothetical protein
MESRKHPKKPGFRLTPSSPLPLDFTRSVQDIYLSNFADALRNVADLTEGEATFEVQGSIFTDEILLAVSLVMEGRIPATTAYCSMDFDPKASSPKAEDLLAIGVDALGGFFDQHLNSGDPALLEQFLSGSLSAMENVPFEWTQIEFEKKRIWIRVDKTNPKLEQMTDDWLAKNDPNFLDEENELEEDAKEMFFTGPKKPGAPSFDDDDD